MKQNLKERVNGKNGITLIALVITIIVLLILAGVTIATLTGENGILTRVQSTKTQNEKKTIEEQIHLALQSSRINEGLIIDKAILEEELSNNEMEIIKSDNNELPWTIRKNSYLYMINKNGEFEEKEGIAITSGTIKILKDSTQVKKIMAEVLRGENGKVKWECTGNITLSTTEGNEVTIMLNNNVNIGYIATVTAKVEGKTYQDCITIKIVGDITNASVNNDLEIEIGDILDITKCIKNKENIEEFTIMDVTANAIKESDIAIKGTGEGIATVIVKGLQSEKTNNITVVVKKVAVLGVGSYVNYPVDYDNVGTVTVDAYIPKDDYTGKWRILDLGNYNSDGTYGTDDKPVRLISAGVPLNYYNCDNSSISVANLTTGFFTTPISVSEKNQYNYYRCGFKNEGGIITNINDVRKLFNNNVTAKNGGIPKVQAMTKEDWENLYDTMESTTTSYGADFYDLLAIPCKDREGKFAYTWLASTFSTNLLWYVSGENGNISGSRDDCLGIRPVVSLVSNVSIIKGTNGVWNIKNNS